MQFKSRLPYLLWADFICSTSSAITNCNWFSPSWTSCYWMKADIIILGAFDHILCCRPILHNFFVFPCMVSLFRWKLNNFALSEKRTETTFCLQIWIEMYWSCLLWNRRNTTNCESCAVHCAIAAVFVVVAVVVVAAVIQTWLLMDIRTRQLLKLICRRWWLWTKDSDCLTSCRDFSTSLMTNPQVASFAASSGAWWLMSCASILFKWSKGGFSLVSSCKLWTGFCRNFTGGGRGWVWHN